MSDKQQISVKNIKETSLVACELSIGLDVFGHLVVWKVYNQNAVGFSRLKSIIKNKQKKKKKIKCIINGQSDLFLVIK